MLQFGIHLGTRGAAGTREGLTAIARAAESLGFSHLGLSDHIAVARDVDSPYPYTEDGNWFAHDTGYCLEQLGTLNFVAAITTRIRLLTSVMVLPYREPILAAKMLTTIDVLSEGRLTVGVGAGWMAEEMALLGSPPFDARGQVATEFIDAFKTLWCAPDPRYRGEHVTFAGLLAAPRPVQRPHPPIWGGGETRAARRRAARQCDGWYPVINNPRNPLGSAQRYARCVTDVARMAEEADRDPADLARALLAIGFAITPQPLGGDARRAFQGSVAQLHEDLGAYEAAGLQHLVIAFESDDLNRTLDTLSAFAEAFITPP